MIFEVFFFFIKTFYEFYLGVYNGTKHPDVISGKKTEDEILGEFLDTFEINHANIVIFNKILTYKKIIYIDRRSKR